MTAHQLDISPTGRLLVLEQSGNWAAALRRVGVDVGSGIRETRSVGECSAELSLAPASLLVVEITPTSAAAICTQIFAWESRFPDARAVVVMAPDLRRWEPLLREAGAVHVIDSARRAGEVVGLALRHWRQHPQRADGPRERVWASLPWSQ
jgi:hypothetical protein